MSHHEQYKEFLTNFDLDDRNCNVSTFFKLFISKPDIPSETERRSIDPARATAHAGISSLVTSPSRRHNSWNPRWASVQAQTALSIGRVARSGLVISTKWARLCERTGCCAVSLVAAPTTILEVRPYWDLLAHR